MNILIKMAFNGGRYHGFQVQKNALAICTVLQDAMQKVWGARPDVKGCSRTDAGVHAREYCVSFHFETPLADDKLPLALNAHLPPDIRVFHAQRVAEDFHARYSSVGKEYHYVIRNAAIDDPFTQGLYYRVAGPIDVAAMDAAAQHLVGKHDFSAFMSAGGNAGDTVRTVSAFSVKLQGENVVLRVAADGFLYHMVRIMAGTLLAVGRGGCAIEDIPRILQKGERGAAGDTLAPQGLFLAKVFYPPQKLPDRL